MNFKHILIPEDLQTKHEAIRNGFLEQALLKTEKATPHIERAKHFYRACTKVNNIEELLLLEEFKADIISSCGFSEKAKARLMKDELEESVKKVLMTIFKKNGSDFAQELIYRYLLTKGDALGGSLRNITGASAGLKFSTMILEKLEGKYLPDIETNTSGKIQRIFWDKREMLFDVTPKVINNNIDVILLKGEEGLSTGNLLEKPEKYIACGELKGGIDPAGADEHWKTANSALNRIRVAFKGRAPKLFFIGAAIEASMAKEIFKQLKDGQLSYAANLTNESQMDDITDWLVNL